MTQVQPMDSAIEHALATLYGFADIQWGPRLGGLSSRNTHFTCQNAGWVLKAYEVMSSRELRHLGAISMFLQKQRFDYGVPPLAHRSGAMYFVIGTQAYAVFPAAAGRILHEGDFTDAALEKTAAALAALHALGSAARGLLDPMQAPNVDLGAWETAVEALPLGNLSAAHGALLRDVRSVKHAVLQTGATPGWHGLSTATDFVHGDFHNENILYVGDTPVAIFDFERSCLGSGLVDVLAFVQLACCNTGYGATQLGRAEHFVRAYAAVRGISPELFRAAVQHSFMTMAMSLFLERRLCEGNAACAAMLGRDLAKLQRYLESAGNDLAGLVA